MLTGEVLQRMNRLEAAEAIVSSLPTPDYKTNFQPTYPDEAALVGAVAENLTTEGVTTPEQIAAFTQSLGPVADPDSPDVLIISGGCRETIHADVPIANLAETSVVNLAIIRSSKIKKMVAAQRNRGQYKKPRSDGEEEGPEGVLVPAYMGDLINSEDIFRRTPEAPRLVEGAVQARDLEAELTRVMGEHVPAAHEALSLAYELPFVRTDAVQELDEPTRESKLFLVSADSPWAGLRTNQLDSDIIRLLMMLENTTGVKIGANSSEAHIAGLEERLNPDNIAGKTIYNLRLGLHEAQHFPRILKAIKTHAPNSVTLFDVHGITEKAPNGKKIRNVQTMIKTMNVMAQACKETGVKFGGVHLETITDGRRLECVEEYGQMPTHDGDLDPGLNPKQTRRILDTLAEINDAVYA